VISGTITYGNAIGSPAFRPVPNVVLSSPGIPPVAGLTDLDGSYSLTGFGAGAYTVTPSKALDQSGAISSFDAGLIAFHVAGPPNPHLSGNQLIVADVSGNGTISSFDAGEIAHYVVADPPFGSTGSWRFNPVSKTYPSVTSDITGEDYSALLMGEVSGNWNGGISGRPAGSGPVGSAAIGMPYLTSQAAKDVTIPVEVHGVANKGIIAYQFNLRYDPSVIQPMGSPVDLSGTASRKLTVVANGKEPGLLRVAVYGAYTIEEDGLLLNLRFMAVGAPGTSSPITWENLMFNDGSLQTLAADGLITLF
jgi:hypothetical protein